MTFGKHSAPLLPHAAVWTKGLLWWLMLATALTDLNVLRDKALRGTVRELLRQVAFGKTHPKGGQAVLWAGILD